MIISGGILPIPFVRALAVITKNSSRKSGVVPGQSAGSFQLKARWSIAVTGYETLGRDYTMVRRGSCKLMPIGKMSGARVMP